MRGWAWQDGGGKIKAWSHRNLTQLTSCEANATVFVWWHRSIKKIEEKFWSKIKLKFSLPSSDLDNTAVCNNKGVRLTQKLESQHLPKAKSLEINPHLNNGQRQVVKMVLKTWGIIFEPSSSPTKIVRGWPSPCAQAYKVTLTHLWAAVSSDNCWAVHCRQDRYFKYISLQCSSGLFGQFWDD